MPGGDGVAGDGDRRPVGILGGGGGHGVSFPSGFRGA
jgi:hypothetical protein